MSRPTPRAFNGIASFNSAPRFPVITNAVANPGQTFGISIRAADPDGNSVSYSTNAAAELPGAIVGQTGFFRWFIPTNQPLGDYPITIVATDNGTPPLSDTVTFTITLQTISKGGTTVTSGPKIAGVWSAAGQTSFTIGTEPGATYRVWYKDDLSAAAWSQLGPDFVAANPTASITDTFAGARRFYRVEVVPQ
jgi:hypothetical protein